MIHTLYALIVQGKVWTAIFRIGAVDAIDRDASRSYAFWFLVCGIILVLWGITLHYYIKQTQKPVPSFLGYSLCYSPPPDVFRTRLRFWLLLPQALLMIFGGRKSVLRVSE